MMEIKIDMKHWNKTLGCYRIINGVTYKWLGGCQWRLATKEEQTIKLIEDKSMSNIKITAEVDGKQVPLENISTETFEAIKALQKPKEIPVARVGHYHGEPDDRRLFLKLTDHIRKNVAEGYDVIAINLKNECVNNTWQCGEEAEQLKLYENVKPL